jgi:histidine triad (HIT) family protein
MKCIFCEIARGVVLAQVVFEDDHSIGFLDSRPLFPGHVLLIPRDHIETMADLPDELTGPLFSNARVIARVMESALEAEGSFVAVNNRVSQSVPHLHIHVVPRRKGDGLKGFFWPRQKYKSEAEMESVAELLRSALRKQP